MTSPNDPQPGYNDYQPYGQPYGQQPPPTYGNGHPPLHAHRAIESARTQAIVSLVVNLISVVSCCNIFGIGGAILAGRALGRVTTDLPGARSMTKWSWIVFGVGFAIMAIVMGVAVALDGRDGV